MITPYNRREARDARHRRIRKRVSGTPERPRLAVFRSHQHIYAQLIDDTAGRTLAAASTADATVRDRVKDLTPLEAARLVGETVAERCKAAGHMQVVFDRGGYLYHGRVEALAAGARTAGLEF